MRGDRALKSKRTGKAVILYILLSVFFFSLGAVTVYAAGTTKKDGWYYYTGYEEGKLSNYIYRKGNSLIVQGQLRKAKRENDYTGKKLGRKKWSFKLAGKVKIYSFPEGEARKLNWKTLKEWGWYKKKHFSPAVYFRVRKGKVVYVGIHS